MFNMWILVLLLSLGSNAESFFHHKYGRTYGCDCGQNPGGPFKNNLPPMSRNSSRSKGAQMRQKISQGVEASPNEFPIMAILETSRHYCGAVVITQWHAMTAAHCTFGFHPKQFYLRVGVHNKDIWEERNSMWFYIKSVYDELFDPEKVIHDIAIVLTDKEIRFSQFVGPACLPEGDINYHRQGGMAAGWGSTENKPQAEVLQKVRVQIYNINYCVVKYNIRIPKGGNFICAMSGNEDNICEGDSGGPLMMPDPETGKVTVVGIVSFGYETAAGMCPSRLPGVYTDIYAYLDWINKKIKHSVPGLTYCSKKMDSQVR